jgi:hypothetical protein
MRRSQNAQTQCRHNIPEFSSVGKRIAHLDPSIPRVPRINPRNFGETEFFLEKAPLGPGIAQETTVMQPIPGCSEIGGAHDVPHHSFEHGPILCNRRRGLPGHLATLGLVDTFPQTPTEGALEDIGSGPAGPIGRPLAKVPVRRAPHGTPRGPPALASGMVVRGWDSMRSRRVMSVAEEEDNSCGLKE